jgi:hypothetical protein
MSRGEQLSCQLRSSRSRVKGKDRCASLRQTKIAPTLMHAGDRATMPMHGQGEGMRTAEIRERQRGRQQSSRMSEENEAE